MPIPRRHQTMSFDELARLLLKRVPVIRGRSYIPGRKTPTFTPVINLEPRQVAFRECASATDIDRGFLEEVYAKYVAALLSGRRDMLVLVPRHVRDICEKELFWWGWTLIEQDGEVLTFQRVVFPQVRAVEMGGCDEGAIYQIRRSLLTAWNGRTEAQNAFQAV